MADVGRILIVGGGIAGPAPATALHQHGCTAEITERSPPWQALGAGIPVRPNGIRILRALGLGLAIGQARTVIRY
jgi:salicylate hydroxylase